MISCICRLEQNNTVLCSQLFFNRIQSFFRLAVIYTDIGKYTESLWFDVNLAFLAFFGSDFFAKCIVGTEIKALYEITPLMGIKTLLGGNTEVTFVQGYKRDEKKEESEANWQETSLEDGGGSRKEEQSVDVKVKEGVFVGYRYNDTFGIEPEFCFGHGLSYTTFAYSGAEIKRNGAKLQVSCDVTNTGDRAGKESDVVEVRIGSSSRNIRIARVL